MIEMTYLNSEFRGMNEGWNEQVDIKECEGVIFQCAVILSPLLSSSNVLGQSYSFAFADTAEVISCDVLHFPLEDSRAANNSIAKIGEPESILSSGYCLFVYCFLIPTWYIYPY